MFLLTGMREGSKLSNFDLLPMLVYAQNSRGEYIDCNKYMLDVLGLKEHSQIFGKKDKDLLRPKKENYGVQYTERQTLCEGKSICTLEKLPLKNGKDINLLSFKAPIINFDGKSGVVGIAIDLQKQTLFDFNNQVIEELVDRTKNSALLQFNHDIRSPLNALIGMAQMLKGFNVSSPEMQIALDVLLEASSSLSNFIDSVARDCQTPVKSKNSSFVDLEDLMSSVYKIAKPIAYEKDLSLEYYSELNEKKITFTDKDKLFRILTELTNNALKHTKQGKVMLACRKPSDDNLLQLEISDTGAGIPDDHVKYLLNPMSVIDESALFEGSGFGLRYVGLMIKTLGIDINVYNKHKTSGSTILINMKEAI